MNVIDAKNGRFYEIDGEFYPSVTTILGKVVPMGYYFHKWLGDANSFQETQEYMREKGDEGTIVHNLCEELLEGKEVDVSVYNRAIIKKTQGFINWWNDGDYALVEKEQIVYSKEYKFAGRFDLLIYDRENDEKVLIDIKTSANVYDSHKIQLMMYEYARREMSLNSGYGADKLNVLLLKETTKNSWQSVDVEYFPDMVGMVMHYYDWAFNEYEPEFEEELPKKLKL